MSSGCIAPSLCLESRECLTRDAGYTEKPQAQIRSCKQQGPLWPFREETAPDPKLAYTQKSRETPINTQTDANPPSSAPCGRYQEFSMLSPDSGSRRLSVLGFQAVDSELRWSTGLCWTS